MMEKIELEYKRRSLGVFGSMGSEGEWEEFARSTTRKVFAIFVGIPVGLIGVTARVAWAIVTAPLRIFVLAVKEIGELYLMVTNPFVLYKDKEKEKEASD